MVRRSEIHFTFGLTTLLVDDEDDHDAPCTAAFWYRFRNLSTPLALDGPALPGPLQDADPLALRADSTLFTLLEGVRFM